MKYPASDDLLQILQAGIEAVKPSRLIPHILQTPPYPELVGWIDSAHKYVLCLGKAAIASAESLLSMVSIKDHFVLSPYAADQAGLNVHVGTHPFPDEKSEGATRELLEWIRALPVDASLLILVSGGTSALLVSPSTGLTLQSKMAVNRLLIRSGADIREINTVRKHLSAIKGGHLGMILAGRRCLTLVVSDVIGDDLSSIGSGPFYPDPTTFSDACDVLERYDLWRHIPEDARSVLETGRAGQLMETPKPGSLRIPHYIIASNTLARKSATEKAQQLGYSSTMQSPEIAGPVHDAAERFFAFAEQEAPPGSACIWGGETTVHVTGNGTGGRNQHLALLLTPRIAGKNYVFGAAGTDGIDGNSPAAGAWTDGSTYERSHGETSYRDAMENSDSYHYFLRTCQNIVTGPTGTNVMDLYVLLT